MSSVAANLAVVLTKLIDPLSPPTPTDTFVPSSWSAFDRSSPFRVFVPSLIIDAVEASDAAPLRGFELIGSAEERDRERHERQIVLLRDDQLGAVRQLRLRPGRHAQLGHLADRWLLGAIEGSARHAAG